MAAWRYTKFLFECPKIFILKYFFNTIFSGTTHSLVIAPNLEPRSKVTVGNLGTR